MTIKLCELKESRNLQITLSDKPSTFSVEIQNGVIYSYNDDFNLIRIVVSNPDLIDPTLKGLKKLLQGTDIEIIREKV